MSAACKNGIGTELETHCQVSKWVSELHYVCIIVDALPFGIHFIVPVVYAWVTVNILQGDVDVKMYTLLHSFEN